ncbi:MAG: hypothetical protein AAFY15_17065, partial [Cyanobacteria bacterium J06648_11]
GSCLHPLTAVNGRLGLAVRASGALGELGGDFLPAWRRQETQVGIVGAANRVAGSIFGTVAIAHPRASCSLTRSLRLLT